MVTSAMLTPFGIDVDAPPRSTVSASGTRVGTSPTEPTAMAASTTSPPWARATAVTVTAGRDFGDTVEIVAGLRGDERVVANPPDSLASGQVVRVVAPAQRGAGQP